jgi:chromosome segregation ATPase
MRLQFRWLLQTGGFLLLATTVIAQTKAPLPTLTSDDVIGTKSSVPAPTAAVNNASKPPAEKAPAKNAAVTAPEKPADDPKKKAEKDWNERLRIAQAKQSDLERRADQAELQITQLRNQLFSAASRSPELNGQINARIGESTGQRNRLRAEAQAAQQEVATLQAEGRTNAYQVSETKLTNEQGEPDAQAYRAEEEKLQNELSDAQARVEVLRIRLNSLQSEVLKKGNGDNFTLNRLRQERDNVNAALAETRSRIEELNNKLQAHRQKATAARVGSQ